jgi:hypothetical protein
VKWHLALANACAGLLALARSAQADPPAPAPTPPATETPVRRAPLPNTDLAYERPIIYPTFAWLAFQAVPSPEIVVGRQRRIEANGEIDRGPSTAFGLRWQFTPLLWSFGVHRSQSRWRTFVVDPLARQSGSLELSGTFEYIGGFVDRLLVRPGLRIYLPLAQKGEYLSTSLGTSVYSYDGLRVAYDVGIYVLSGILGLQVTVAPTHDPLTAITTVRLRYF